ncbi:hypothetical protein AB7M49_004200 [Bradyrhizobium elkanii]
MIKGALIRLWRKAVTVIFQRPLSARPRSRIDWRSKMIALYAACRSAELAAGVNKQANVLAPRYIC